MKFGIIYKIINNINNKIYVGQTWHSLKKRFNNHVSKNNGCTKLHNAIQKYGKENFFILEIMICENQDQMNFWEDFFIKLYDSIKNGYNLREGGARGKFSEEAKKNLSKSHLGIKPSKETRQKLSQAHKGKTFSSETRAKISAAKRGKKFGPLSEETKLKQSKALKGRVLSDDHKNKLRIAANNRKGKISFEDADRMKEMKKLGLSSTQIALKFNISASYVRGILNNTNRRRNDTA